MNNKDLSTAWYYCQNKVASPGSDWYYALLKLPETRRQACLALLTLEHDWRSLRTIDPEPAQIKLAWWQQQLATHQTDHPALQLLAPIADSLALPNTLLPAMLASAVVPPYRFEAFIDVQRAAYNMISAPLLIGLYVLSPPQVDIATPIHQLIFSWQLWALLRTWPQSQQTVFFAEADLYTFGLANLEPAQWPHTDCVPLLEQYHQQANALYQTASAALRQHPDLKPLLRYAKLQASLAKRYQLTGFPKRIPRLNPLQKLWHTWFL